MENIVLQNPFSITKATEFTDIEINDYWINFSFGDDKTVFNMLNPNEFMPKYIPYLCFSRMCSFVKFMSWMS